MTDELNAFKVFETLNARGVKLSATDLLKNYLFSLMHSQTLHSAEMKSLEVRWERIVSLLGNESFPEFLRVFWNSRHKLVRKSNLFKTIRNHITSRDQAFQLIKALDQSAAVYAALRDQHDQMWNTAEKRNLQQLLLFNVRQPLALLLTCYQKFYEQEQASFTKILKAIAIISFRYNVICHLPSHEQERLYNDIAVKISKNTSQTSADIIAALKKISPEDALFKAAFAKKTLQTLNGRNRKIVRYMLFEIERQQSGREFDFESARYSLEHILPENPNSDWSAIDEAKQDRLIYRIGNMTILETKVNRDLGNQDFNKKRLAYQNSDFEITKAIAENYDSWTEAKIESRQKQLSNIAASIWRI